MTDPLLADLRAAVGDANVLTDADVTASYETDWTGRYQGRARAVVRPTTTGEVAAAVRACHAHGAAIVPQGGNTGLVGGSVPRHGEVLLSLRRLDWIDPVDAAASQVAAGAGATLADLQDHVRRAGFQVGVDFAARDSATVGGVVATNAGGERVLRFGMTRTQVLGVEAVLPDGSVLDRLTGLVKDNSGYDLRSLLVGSEGTLGVITAARLRVFNVAPHRSTALLALDGTDAAVAALGVLRRRIAGIEAAEIFYAEGLDLVCAQLDLPRPGIGAASTYVLVEGTGDEPVDEPLAAAIAEVDGLRDAVLAQGRSARDRLWEYREGHTLAIAARGVPLKLDIAVPLSLLAAFERSLRSLLADEVPGADLVLFGHLAEGNYHVNLLGVPGDEAERVTEVVLRHVREHDGSISAEHGVGVAKARWLGLARSPQEVGAMRAIKAALDPGGLLNPGVLFDPGAG